MTIKKLENLLKYWQKILRLRDWDIKIEFKRGRDMPGNNTGNLSVNEQYKTAMISILDPIDRDEIEVGGEEEGIVHELIHIHFQTLLPLEIEFVEPFETGVNMITQALIGIKRDGR